MNSKVIEVIDTMDCPLRGNDGQCNVAKSTCSVDGYITDCAILDRDVVVTRVKNTDL